MKSTSFATLALCLVFISGSWAFLEEIANLALSPLVDAMVEEATEKVANITTEMQAKEDDTKAAWQALLVQIANNLPSVSNPENCPDLENECVVFWQSYQTFLTGCSKTIDDISILEDNLAGNVNDFLNATGVLTNDFLGCSDFFCYLAEVFDGFGVAIDGLDAIGNSQEAYINAALQVQTDFEACVDAEWAASEEEGTSLLDQIANC